ncbi:DinB family protein [Rossellomorea aquimaris]|uniref:DinB family protein n=1 Tax=Rossellomorea aquimaris TaxID=189382 RepID=A0A5D4UGY2_9BACI|nr:DinB family protein [Rossellomorea aquimaris]TYS77615.1 DinB family protein [Rossellomorea aquimaris]TYS86797.1 DinB family protein [Rossellomorea aquimaris]TYS87600.1 DinB family protein [Rossellomorea aquimaris]
MNSINLIILNFNEVRRRSIKVWTSIPQEKLKWKPDDKAMTCLEMIRHVLESEHYYHLAIKNRGSLSNFDSPFEIRPFTSVNAELDFAEPYRKQFLDTIKSFSEEDLKNIKIDRSDSGYIRDLGDMLLRVAYHESVHTGQLLDYLRSAGIPRIRIWD